MVRKRWLFMLLRGLIAIVVVVCVFVAWRRAVAELQSMPGELSWARLRWDWMIAGWGCSISGLLPTWIGWHQTLRDFRQMVDWRHSFYAYFLGHMGKYVPGKAMAVLLRVGHLHRIGALVRPSIVSVIIETLTSLASGGLLGAIFALAMPLPSTFRWMAFASIPIFALSLVPHTFRWLVTMVSRSRIGSMPAFVAKAITWRLMLRTSAWSFLGWTLNGTAAWMVLMAITPDPTLLSVQAWMVCVAAMSLGVLAGFLSMLPGGVAVRELVAMWILTTLVPQPVALASSIVARLILMAGELTLLTLASLLCPRSTRPTAVESSASQNE